MRALPALTLLSAALLGGCVSVATHGDPAAALGPPPDDSLNATAWYQSLERELISREVYRAAARQLDEALADPAWRRRSSSTSTRPCSTTRPARCG